MKIRFLENTAGQIAGHRAVTYFQEGEVWNVGEDIDSDLAMVFVEQLKVAEVVKDKPAMTAENKVIKPEGNKKRGRKKKEK